MRNVGRLHNIFENCKMEMTSEEKSKQLIDFKSLHEAAMAEHEANRKIIKSLSEKIDKLVASQASNLDYKTLYEASQKQKAELLKRLSSLEEQLRLSNEDILNKHPQKKNIKSTK